MTAAARRVLALNAGSSSLKFALFEGPTRSCHGLVEGFGTDYAKALAGILGQLAERGVAIPDLAACGHRIVHGGSRYVAPMLLDAGALEALNALRQLAPLHNRHGLEAIDALRAIAPALPQVACFDTAFHATVPEVASRYALPAGLHEAGYRRFGFHGLNFEHVTRALAARCGGRPPARLLIFHLGNGCSACAVHEGRSVGTTMGYSTLDGLTMGTRCGSIDPGVVLSLQRDRGMDADAVADLLYRRSGLLGLSGRTNDMRELLRAAADGDADCALAVEHFCYWAARHAASLVVALGGLDAIAFTGGIGTGSAAVRARIARHLAWLGVELDAARNEAQAEDIGATGARCAAWRILADEEAAIMGHVHAVLGAGSR